MTGPVVLGSRGSALALRQTELVVEHLRAAHPGLVIRVETIRTSADHRPEDPFDRLPGVGFFVKELEVAVLEGRIDAAVHSMKDLPVEPTPGLLIGAVPPREDPRDVLVARAGLTLQTLPSGARVGTSSPRRAAYLRAARPDLIVVPVRGNVDTRLRKIHDGTVDAVCLAAAGLQRLGLAQRVTQWLPFEVALPAPGQGALGVQVRAGDVDTLNVVSASDHLPTRRAVEAERALLHRLQGGCGLPVGAFAEVVGDRLSLRAAVVAPDGTRIIEGTREGVFEDAEAIGTDLAEELLARGAGALMPAEGGPGVKPPRILVTRPARQAAELSDLLRRAGFEPVEVPAIAIAPPPNWTALDATLSRLAAYQWIVVTSRNAVEAVFDRMAGLGVPLPTTVRWAAIGPGTAAALAAFGVTDAWMPTRFLSEAMVDELPARAGERVLRLRAEAAAEIAPALRERGIAVDEVVAYRTIEAPPASVPLLRDAVASTVDAVVLTSASTARGLVALARTAGVEGALRAVPIVAIGPVTAASARAAGLNVSAVAEEHTTRGVAEALHRRLEHGARAVRHR